MRISSGSTWSGSMKTAGASGWSSALNATFAARASREVLATPTLFVDAVLHNGGYDTESLMRALES
jgi:hypothetical protein